MWHLLCYVLSLDYFTSFPRFCRWAHHYTHFEDDKTGLKTCPRSHMQVRNWTLSSMSLLFIPVSEYSVPCSLVYHQVVINCKCLFHDKAPPNLSQSPALQSRRLGRYGLLYACVFLYGQCLSARNTQDTPVTPRLVYWLVGTRENPHHRKPCIILIESARTTSKICLGLC